MTKDERGRRGKTLCATLVEDIAKVASPGLGRWPDAWEIVGEESADFMDALLSWEETGEPDLT